MLKRTVICCFLLMAAAGCFRINYRLAPPSGETYKNTYWNAFFVAGLIPVQEVYDFEGLCRGVRTVEVRSYQTPPNALATLFGFVTAATTLEAVCSKEPAKPAATPPPPNRRRFPF